MELGARDRRAHGEALEGDVHRLRLLLDRRGRTRRHQEGAGGEVLSAGVEAGQRPLDRHAAREQPVDRARRLIGRGGDGEARRPGARDAPRRQRRVGDRAQLGGERLVGARPVDPHQQRQGPGGDVVGTEDLLGLGPLAHLRVALALHHLDQERPVGLGRQEHHGAGRVDTPLAGAELGGGALGLEAVLA